MSTDLPVTVIGGYLGSGKTTLVNHLLRHADGCRLAVMVNDFGTLPIDADLIEAEDETIKAITGGCLCCSFGNDLAGALADLKALPNPIDHILIEASGVALPGAIASSIELLQGFQHNGVAVLCDVETVQKRARDKYMGDTIQRQLDDADLLLLNKVDLVSDAFLASSKAWLAGAAPNTPIIACTFGTIPLGVLIDPNFSIKAPVSGPTHDVQSAFRTIAFEIGHPVDANLLAKALADPKMGLVRAKGFVHELGGGMTTIQIVGERFSVSPAPASAGCGLVCIGPIDQINEAAIRAAMDNVQKLRKPA